MVALIVSIGNLYFSQLQHKDIAVYVAPRIGYGRDAKSYKENFVIPVTFVNDGARPSVILYLTLTVTHSETGREKTYDSKYIFKDTQIIDRPFAPISISGKNVASCNIGFYDLGSFDKLFFGFPGKYIFKLNGKTSNADSVKQFNFDLHQKFEISLSSDEAAEIHDDQLNFVTNTVLLSQWQNIKIE